MNADTKVSSVSEFIDCILKEHRSGPSFRESEISCLTFYRGQSNKAWKLSPRLFREGLLGKERALIEEIKRIYPSEFQGLEYFDQLVKMQHYGIPTRLLDTTLNPLVALFFACHEQEQINEDGCVFVFPRLPVYRPSHWHILVSMIYSFKFSGERVDLHRAGTLLKMTPGMQNHVSEENPEDVIKTCVLGWPFSAVIPNLNNRRVQNQDGAFLICNMREGTDPRDPRTYSRTKKISYIQDRDVQKDLMDWKGTFTIMIPSEYKSRILDELALLGFHRSKLFPELEHQAELILQGIRGTSAES